ncbi:MAG: peptide chain release factor N(5)-glutamine methyltransferase [Pseudomonadota bacterium]|nr:peptide chain release factor N(5)-glutamine methyltransferase [Pseudomonadota bacterium]
MAPPTPPIPAAPTELTGLTGRGATGGLGEVGGLTVATALGEARVVGLDRLDAELLLCHVLSCRRTWVLAHGEAALDNATATEWRGLAARRRTGEPLAYLVGEKEFHGLTLTVDRHVLVPRPDTELLVDRALEILHLQAAGHARPRVVDLGTGSGAIALAVKAACAATRMCASDDSHEALDVARANATRLAIEIEFRAGSWWTPWTGERFDLALANPPYVAVADPHLLALRDEPSSALVAGVDGLSALRAIVAGARGHLEPRGWLLLEHGCAQAGAVQELLHDAGFSAVETLRDLDGNPRCTGGKLGGVRE